MLTLVANLPPVSMTPAVPVANLPPVVHLDLRISPQIFEKILNDPMSFSGTWGKMKKNLKQKSRDTVPLNGAEKKTTCPLPLSFILFAEQQQQ